MRFKNFIFILALFMVLLCCFSAVSASENVDDSVSVSDDVAMDEVVSEVDSDDESISVQENEEIESSDDVDNESLAVQYVEQVDDVDDTTLTAENDNSQILGEYETVDLDLDIDNINYGEYTYVWVGVDSDGGYVNVTVNNQTYTDYDNWGGDFYTDITELLLPGQYTVDVVFVDEENGLYGSGSISFEVYKMKTDMKITNVDENFNITGVLKSKDAPINGTTVFYTIDGGDRLNTTTDEEGIFNIKVDENDNIIMFYYDGDKLYDGATFGIAIKPLILYVGPQTTLDSNGSYDNPYPSLIDAWKFVDGQNISVNTNIIIYLKNGTYVFNSDEVNEVVANSKNQKGFILNKYMNVTIQAIDDGEVDFKFYCDKFIFDLYSEDFISLTYSGINFIFDNTDIFLGVGYRRLPTSDKTVGDLSYNNCTFSNFKLGFTDIGSLTSIRTFTDCYFDGNGLADYIMTFTRSTYNSINYCTFYNVTGKTMTSTNTNMVISIMPGSTKSDFNYNWWGCNNPNIANPTGLSAIDASVIAVYNTFVNPIGNGKFEVIGKLTWNDGTNEGIERIHEMPVSLVSSTGTFNDSNPILKNGQFKVIYTSENEYNEITATLDREVQTLRFNNVNVSVDVNNVDYGDYAKVTVSVPANINGNISVTVNNKIYSIKTNKTTVDFVIDQILNPGNYLVNVTFVDEENSLYGYSSASLVVNKFDTTITIVSIGNEFEISGVLKDVKSNIANATIFYSINGGDRLNTTTGEDGMFTILVRDNCEVKFFFDGSDEDNPSNTSIALKNIKPVRKAAVISAIGQKLTLVAVDKYAGEKGGFFYITLTEADGVTPLANKTVKFGLNGIIYSINTDKNGKAGLKIDLFQANTYSLAISFLGDEEYNATLALYKLVITKKTSSITPKKTKYTFKVNKKNKYIKATMKTSNKYLKAGKTVKLTVKGKTYVAKTGKNGAIKFNIGALKKKGTYNAKIKFSGDATYKACSSKKIKIVVK